MTVTSELTILASSYSGLRKVSLVHPSLNRMGGAEKILIETIRLLNEEGYETTLYTIDRVNWGLLESKWGVKTRQTVR